MLDTSASSFQNAGGQQHERIWQKFKTTTTKTTKNTINVHSVQSDFSLCLCCCKVPLPEGMNTLHERTSCETHSFICFRLSTCRISKRLLLLLGLSIPLTSFNKWRLKLSRYYGLVLARQLHISNKPFTQTSFMHSWDYNLEQTVQKRLNCQILVNHITGCFVSQTEASIFL